MGIQVIGTFHPRNIKGVVKMLEGRNCFNSLFLSFFFIRSLFFGFLTFKVFPNFPA